MTAKIIATALVIFFGLIAMRGFLRAASSDDDRMLARRIVRIRGPIDDRVANDVIARLLFLQKRSATEPIQLLIDSPGGGISPGLAIIDTLEMIKAPVCTRCENTAHSMALVILVCGLKGYRSASSSAILAFSMPQAPAGASEHQKAEAERFAGILIDKVVAATAIPEAKVREMFVHSTSLSGAQAYEQHLIDNAE